MVSRQRRNIKIHHGVALPEPRDDRCWRTVTRDLGIDRIEMEGEIIVMNHFNEGERNFIARAQVFVSEE
jgi:hypothetical protein